MSVSNWEYFSPDNPIEVEIVGGKMTFVIKEYKEPGTYTVTLSDGSGFKVSDDINIQRLLDEDTVHTIDEILHILFDGRSIDEVCINFVGIPWRPPRKES